MKLVVTAVSATLILWRRASALESPTDVPPSTLPAREVAPVRANIASRSVVLPLWKGPTSAMHRGPRGLLTSCPISPSPLLWSSALDWVGKRICSACLFGLASEKSSLRCGVGARTLPQRHCERSEAIHTTFARRVWIASSFHSLQ